LAVNELLTNSIGHYYWRLQSYFALQRITQVMRKWRGSGHFVPTMAAHSGHANVGGTKALSAEGAALPGGVGRQNPGRLKRRQTMFARC
jgi:hypothetical protein